MKNICNLPRDSTEEVLSRVPLTSLRRVRSTCRKWNTLCKDMSFAKKQLAQAKLGAAQGKDTMVVTMMDFRVYLMRFNLSTTNNNVDESCIKPKAKLIGPDGLDEINVSAVFHCYGLLLCVLRDYTKLVVWNPYWGQTRWIKPTHNLHGLGFHAYALGHDKSSNSHKILRFVDQLYLDYFEFSIYDFNSDSWRVLDVSPRDWMIESHDHGVSLKGNTYWFARKTREYVDHFLICFDFTRDTFGPHLPLPFVARRADSVSLSSVREEQLAVLFQASGTLQIQVWVTTKIEPDAVSWSSKLFLSANLIRPRWQILIAPSFFIDEEKKIAVVFDRCVKGLMKRTRNVAYIIGVDGWVKEEDVGESREEHCTTLVCSYVPSLVQLN